MAKSMVPHTTTNHSTTQRTTSITYGYLYLLRLSHLRRRTLSNLKDFTEALSNCRELKSKKYHAALR